ncbi:MAG: hypothetical protein RLZZ139_4114 [Cyanobacteriota bacterium]
MITRIEGERNFLAFIENAPKLTLDEVRVKLEGIGYFGTFKVVGTHKPVNLLHLYYPEVQRQISLHENRDNLFAEVNYENNVLYIDRRTDSGDLIETAYKQGNLPSSNNLTLDDIEYIVKGIIEELHYLEKSRDKEDCYFQCYVRTFAKTLREKLYTKIESDFSKRISLERFFIRVISKLGDFGLLDVLYWSDEQEAERVAEIFYKTWILPQVLDVPDVDVLVPTLFPNYISSYA